MDNRGCRGSPAGFHPHFLFGEPQKENGGGAVKRKNALPPGSRARSALPPGGMRVVTVLLSWGSPCVTTGGVPIRPPGPSTPCCTTHLSGKDRIDQLLFPRSPLRLALPGWLQPVAETTASPLLCGEANPAGKGTDCRVAPLLAMTGNERVEVPSPAPPRQRSGAERGVGSITSFGPLVTGVSFQCPVCGEASARFPVAAESLPRGGTEPAPYAFH